MALSKKEFLDVWEAVFHAADFSGDGIVTRDEIIRLVGKCADKGDQKSMVREIMTMSMGDDQSQLSLKKYMKFGEETFDKNGPFGKERTDPLVQLSKLGEGEKKAKENDKVAKELKEMFDRYDADNNGTLDIGELKYFAAQMGAPLDKQELKDAMGEMDKDNSGSVSFEELYQWWTHANRSKKDTSTVAKLYAKATRDYLSEGARSLLSKISKEELKKMISTSATIRMGDVDEKNQKGVIDITLVKFDGESAGRLEVSFSADQEQGEKVVAAFTAIIDAVASDKSMKMGPFVKGFSAEYKDGEVVLVAEAPMLPKDPFKKLPVPVSSVVKDAKITISLPFTFDELLTTEKKLLELCEMNASIKYTANKRFMMSMFSKFETSSYIPREVMSMIFGLAMFKSAEGTVHLNSGKEIFDTLMNFKSFSMRFNRNDKEIMNQSVSSLLKTSRSKAQDTVEKAKPPVPPPLHNTANLAINLVNAIRGCGELKRIVVGAKSAGKQVKVEIKGLLPTKILPDFSGIKYGDLRKS